MLSKAIEIFRKYGFSELIVRSGIKMSRPMISKFRHRLNFTGRHKMLDMSRGGERLLIIVAGYKPFLWKYTLYRVARYAPKDMDICIVSPGVFSQELHQICESNHWSYLWSEANKLALAQNIAISKHPNAKWIYKLDEDIFVSKDYFDDLLSGYLRVRSDGSYDPGFCAPLLNVNGYSYLEFLRALNLDQDYRALFGELRNACMGVKVHYSGETALWIWRKSLPFDETALLIRDRPFGYSAVPHRFSIGAILLERSFWNEIGGFKVSLTEAALGVEEEHICNECNSRSRPMVLIHNVFAGHFAFGPQESTMVTHLGELHEHLRIDQPNIGEEKNVSSNY